MLEPRRLMAVDEAELHELIRPAGYFRMKAQRLRNLLTLLIDRYDGSIDAMRAESADVLREQLLAVRGVGPETADSILLYALDKPIMVVDAYTHRIFARHGWTGYDADYHLLQEEIAMQMPSEVPELNELHALLVNVGKNYCRKRNPRCEDCPLADYLPEGGIVTDDFVGA